MPPSVSDENGTKEESPCSPIAQVVTLLLSISASSLTVLLSLAVSSDVPVEKHLSLGRPKCFLE